MHKEGTGMSEETLTIRALKLALRDNDNGALDWADEYGEPGYVNSEKGILFANWNEAERTMAARANERARVRAADDAEPLTDYEAPSGREAWRRLEDRLERMGFVLECYDEWYVDGGRSPCKAYRTQPDCHGWEPRVRMIDGDMLTPDDDAQHWIDDALNEEGRPLPSWFDDSELETRGFALIDMPDRQVGFYPGQNDDPHKFMPALQKKGFDVVLQITDRGQFDVRYRVWTRKEVEDTDQNPRAEYCEYEDKHFVYATVEDMKR